MIVESELYQGRAPGYYRPAQNADTDQPSQQSQEAAQSQAPTEAAQSTVRTTVDTTKPAAPTSVAAKNAKPKQINPMAQPESTGGTPKALARGVKAAAQTNQPSAPTARHQGQPESKEKSAKPIQPSAPISTPPKAQSQSPIKRKPTIGKPVTEEASSQKASTQNEGAGKEATRNESTKVSTGKDATEKEIAGKNGRTETARPSTFKVTVNNRDFKGENSVTLKAGMVQIDGKQIGIAKVVFIDGNPQTVESDGTVSHKGDRIILIGR